MRDFLNSRISKFSYHLLVRFRSVTLELTGSHVTLLVQMEKAHRCSVTELARDLQ